ncbi:MAG: hypothetical protein MI919_43030 [Holophagales bacterium]|nr:hypothetical protein [Holophagales bacterium]
MTTLRSRCCGDDAAVTHVGARLHLAKPLAEKASRNSPMRALDIRDLRRRKGQLVLGAESGEISRASEPGRPVLVAAPISGRIFGHGVHNALAVKLYEEGALSL